MKVKSKPKPLVRASKAHLFERIRRSNWQQKFVLFFICIFSLTTYPVSASFLLSSPTSSSATATEAQTDNTALPGSETLSTTASALSSSGSDGLKGAAASAATGYAASSAQDWLSQFGTAKVKINMDDNGNWDDSSLDFLLPLYDNQQQLLFTQLGYRAPDGRNTGNFGLGVRVFNLEDWMFGGNVFFDDDFTGKNRRFGAGAEAWTDFLKLGFNTYAGTTDWHSSRDYADYNEKPADGFDIRADGYLPAYPQLGGKLMYEKYYGDDVALFDKDTLQNNPSAVTVGLNYTPIPLVTAGIDYRRGQDSVDETEFSLNFRYALGQPWGAQISSDQVAVRRSLAGSRYDLVDRNNEIVLQYKKKEQNDALADMTLTSIQDNSPADGATNNTVMVHAVTSDGSAAKNAAITWSVSGTGKLSATSGVTDGNGNATVGITDSTAEQVTVNATSGSITRSVPSSFNESVSSLNLKLTDNNSKADGVDTDSGQVTVRDASGKVMSGVSVSWNVDHSATIVHSDAVTDGSGHASVEYTDTKAESVKLTASASGKTESTNSAFIAAVTTNTISVIMTTDNAQADGVTPNVARATVKDSTGKALPNVTVNWATTGSAKLSAGSSVTDANGNATVNLTDSVAESGLTVTATAGEANATTTTTFVGVQQNIAVVMTTDNSPADSVTPNVARATVTDNNGKPRSGVTVSWATTGSAKLSAGSSVTDANGNATVNLTDSVAESGLTVTATTGNAKGSTTTTFVEIQKNIVVTMTTDNSPADSVTPNVASATVTDSSGKPLSNVTVNWTTSGSAKLAATSSVTNGSGIATVNLTDSVAESGLTVTATAGDAKGSTTTTFKGIQQNIVVAMTTDNSPADSVTPNVARATVTDSSGKALSNVTVNWTTTGSAKLSAGSSVTDANGNATVNLTDSVAESGLTVTATTGNAKGSTTTTFVEIQKNIVVTMTTDNSPADSVTPNVASATVTDSSGKPLSNVTVNWTTSGSAKLAATSSVTNGSGIATVNLTDSVAESGLTVTATAGEAKGSTTTTFVEIQKTIAVQMTTDNSVADGVTPNVASATVTDSSGKPLSNVTVNWTTSGSAKLAATSSVTNSSGIATVNLTDTVAESGLTVTATAGSAKGSTTTTFKSALDTIIVTTTTDNSPADGMSTNVVNAMVKDANGKALSGVTVNWSVTGSAALKAPTSVTDSSGNATMSLTDSVVESNLTVTATVGDAKGTTLTTFSQLQQDVTVTMKVNNSVADGTAQNIAQVVVLKDSRPVSGAEVSWSKDSSNAKNASSPTAYTDSNGVATMFYTDTVPETFNVVATVGDETGKAQSTFVAPEFGPITLLMPEVTDGLVNFDIALGGTPVVIQHYNGMAAGDQIAVTSNVTDDRQGKTLDYNAPVYTVSSGDIGHDITLTLPAGTMMGISGSEDGTSDDTAHLHVKAVVTQGERTQTGTLSYKIDTCPPGGLDICGTD